MSLDSSHTLLRTDHLGRVVKIPVSPQRIVSLCPSQTETLFDLGLSAQVVGRTRFCIHPQPEIKSIQQVGGTKEVNFDRIDALKPDLILCEKEENTPEMVAELEKKYPVYVTDVVDMVSALKMIRDIAEICGKKGDGIQMAQEIENEFAQLMPVSPPLTTAYFIWKDPYMVVGKDTYIDCMLEKCGMKNVFRDFEGRYPTVQMEDILQANPHLILLSSEPYPFKEEHLNAFLQKFPETEVKVVDGEMFTWYGSRMRDMPLITYES